METPLLVLRPNIMNALLPMFGKNLGRTLLIALPLVLAASVLKLSKVLAYPLPVVVAGAIILAALLAGLPLLKRLIVLSNTKYYFEHDRVISEYELFRIKRHSMPYSQITNISIEISLWDRLCNTGDILLQAGQEVAGHEGAAGLTLHYIRDPHRIEKIIYQLIHHSKRQ